MNCDEWNQKCGDVVEKMKEHVKTFTTPISKALTHNEGEHLGSASFINVAGSIYIVTNEHVANETNYASRAHQYHGATDVVRLLNPVYAKPYPIDFAVSKIHEKSWTACSHNANGIPESRFAKKHDPVTGELLFFMGYSGERSKFLFGTLFAPGTPYLTQEIEFPSGLDIGDNKFHFALPYLTEKAWAVDGNTRGLPDPHGMSGSIVWNTKFIETTQKGQAWNPELAVVTGIIWGWPSSVGCLIATRVEHLDITSMATSAEKRAKQLDR